jgi:sulfur carrier protein
MQIALNDIFIEIAQNTSILKLLMDNNLFQEKGIAVALNDIVIPKKMWEVTFCNENDTLLVIKASAGG